MGQQVIATPAAPLIVFGVLKGYMKGAGPFMISTILKFPPFAARLRKETGLPKDFIRSSGFMLHLYGRLQQRFTKEKAFEITRASVLCSALAIMQANFKSVEEKRSFENLVRNQQQANKIGVTRLNTMEILNLDYEKGEYRFCVTKCMFFEFFQRYGAPELTSIMCSADNAIFNSYLPNQITFHRGVGRTMLEGAEKCDFLVRRIP